MPTSWRVARSLNVLLEQVNTSAPRRGKASDGALGDLAHSKTKSEHNPDAQGVVRARDFTHDPANGFDAHAFADRLLASRDPRILYIISRGRIGASYSRPGRAAWAWGPYSGSNKHHAHAHVSVVPGAAADTTTPWRGASPEVGKAPAAPAPARASAPTDSAPGVRVLVLADPAQEGQDVRTWQGELWRLGIGVGDHDGRYGPASEGGTRTLQGAAGITVDGQVGPHTRTAAGRVPTYPKPPGPDMAYAATGGPADTVRAFQARLAARGWTITVDGVCGPVTQRALRLFQEDHGLRANGVGGAQTWVALHTRPVK